MRSKALQICCSWESWDWRGKAKHLQFSTESPSPALVCQNCIYWTTTVQQKNIVIIIETMLTAHLLVSHHWDSRHLWNCRQCWRKLLYASFCCFKSSLWPLIRNKVQAWKAAWHVFQYDSVVVTLVMNTITSFLLQHVCHHQTPKKYWYNGNAFIARQDLKLKQIRICEP